MNHRQILLVLVICAFAFGLGFILWLNTRSHRSSFRVESVKFDFPTDKVDPNAMRIQHLESKLAINELEKNEIKNSMMSILKQMEINQQLFAQQLVQNSDKLLTQLDQKLIDERKQMTLELNKKLYEDRIDNQEMIQLNPIEIESDQTASSCDSEIWYRNPIGPRPGVYAGNGPIPPSFEDPIRRPTKSLVIACSSEKMSKKKFLQNSIPMGLSVKAILLSGMDAVCGVYSKSEPVPVKLQLLEIGKLPNKLRSEVKRAVILASAYGDISSERVVVRLERLRITNLDGSYYDTEISGFVTGEDGKYGIRGKVVDRSVKMIKNAATSGALQEMSNLAQASISKNNVNISSWSSAPQMLGGGVVGGSSRALEMLADYYIKRAEHVQPVLQVDAGRIMDITFSFSVEVGELDVKEKIKEVRNRSRMEEEA
jgi:conjugal transfer pilus assembly protein TraB